MSDKKPGDGKRQGQDRPRRDGQDRPTGDGYERPRRNGPDRPRQDDRSSDRPRRDDRDQPRRDGSDRPRRDDRNRPRRDDRDRPRREGQNRPRRDDRDRPRRDDRDRPRREGQDRPRRDDRDRPRRDDRDRPRREGQDRPRRDDRDRPRQAGYDRPRQDDRDRPRRDDRDRPRQAGYDRPRRDDRDRPRQAGYDRPRRDDRDRPRRDDRDRPQRGGDERPPRRPPRREFDGGSADGERRPNPFEPPSREGSTLWERHGRLWIAVSTLERRRVATPVEGQAAEVGGANSAVVRLRKEDRHKAIKPHRRFYEPPAEEEAAPPLARALSAAGRAGQAVDEALSALLRDDPAWAPLRPTEDEMADALGRLGPNEQQRWLSLRNGAPKTLRPSRIYEDREAIEAILNADYETSDETDTTTPEARARTRARELWNDAPVQLWNLAAEAHRDAWMSARGARAAEQATLLDGDSPLELPLPAELALPLLPYVATWRVARMLQPVEEADSEALARIRAAAPTMLEPQLRSAVFELASRLDAACPPVDDDDAWGQVAVHLLRQLIDSEQPLLRRAADRPAEPAMYLKIASELLELERPWLAGRAITAALAAQPDHKRALRLRPEADKALEAKGDRLVALDAAQGTGSIELPAGPHADWRAAWAANEEWVPEARLEELDLPATVEAALQEAGYNTAGELRAEDPQVLFSTPGMGRAGLRAVRLALNRHATEARSDASSNEGAGDGAGNEDAAD